MMEKRKKLQAKIVSASNDKFVIRIGDISKTPKVGDSLVVTIPSRAKVEMVRKTNSLSGVRITDTIARGKVIGVNEGVVTVKPMVSRTNVAKLQQIDGQISALLPGRGRCLYALSKTAELF